MNFRDFQTQLWGAKVSGGYPHTIASLTNRQASTNESSMAMSHNFPLNTHIFEWGGDRNWLPYHMHNFLPCSSRACPSSSEASQGHWRTARPGSSASCSQLAPGEGKGREPHRELHVGLLMVSPLVHQWLYQQHFSVSQACTKLLLRQITVKDADESAVEPLYPLL